MNRFSNRPEAGLTLIELLVAMTILAILASVVLPLSRVSIKRAKEIELRRNLRIIRNALDDYKRAWDEGRIEKMVGDSGYPKSLKELVDGVNDIKSPIPGRKIKFLRRIPRDPFYPDPTVPAEQTWGLRAYDSDPDNPREGADVFDVYSKSDEIALDGTPYKTW